MALSPSLTALGGMTANNPLELQRLRQQQLDEMERNQELEAWNAERAPSRPITDNYGFEGSYQSSPTGNQYVKYGRGAGSPTSVSGATASGVNQLQQDMAEDPYTGQQAQADVAGEDQLRKLLFDYNRPDVSGMRNEELANKERLATAPARVTGQYGLEAAKIAGPYRVSAAQAAAEARQAAAEEATARTSMSQAGMDRRQQTGQAFTREGQQLKGEIPNPNSFWNRLMGRSPAAQSSQGVHMRTPDGRDMPNVPAERVAEMEALGAVRVVQ